MTQTVDIIGTIVSGLVMTGTITSTSVSAGVMTVNTTNTYWLNKGSKVTIGVTEYDVTSVVYNTSFTIAETSISGTEFTIPAPRYIHGKQTKVNNERQGLDIQMAKGKCPFIWVVEPFKETTNNWQSSIAKNADLTVIFLDYADYSAWTTNEHYTEVITPMDALKVEFFKAIDYSRLFEDMENINELRQVVFGTTETKGSSQSILDETLSGIETRATYKIRKQYCN